jgi:hypothetical protein
MTISISPVIIDHLFKTSNILKLVTNQPKHQIQQQTFLNKREMFALKSTNVSRSYLYSPILCLFSELSAKHADLLIQ